MLTLQWRKRLRITLRGAGQPQEDAEGSAELASWLAFVTDGACAEQEVRDRARRVHQVLSFRLHQPRAYTFCEKETIKQKLKPTSNPALKRRPLQAKGLLKYFDVRKGARTSEMDAMGKAKVSW